VVWHGMQLYIAPAFANVVFQHSAGRVECVANRNIGILMRVSSRWFAADDDLSTRHDNFDPNLEQIALVAAWMPAFDDNPACSDAAEEAIELLGAAADTRRKRVRAIHMTKRDLERHRVLPS
jgi:hypothetical protein